MTRQTMPAVNVRRLLAMTREVGTDLGLFMAVSWFEAVGEQALEHASYALGATVSVLQTAAYRLQPRFKRYTRV